MKIFGLEIRKAKRRGTPKAAYTGAARGRRTDGWITNSASGNSEVGMGIMDLRDRSRDLCRNNPMAAKGKRAYVGNLYSDGIYPRSNTGDEALDAQVDALFLASSKEMDAEGGLWYGGLVYRSIDAFAESGDVFVRRRLRFASDGLLVPMQLQILEADMVPSDLTQPTQSGGRVIQGIEFDPIGRRTAYHCYRYHPGEMYTDTSLAGIASSYSDTVAVPASSIAHLFDSIGARPGQCRGVPFMSPVIRPLRDLDDYCDAERERKKGESSLMAVVTGGDESDPADGEDADGLGMCLYDADNRLIDHIEPGMIAHVRPGKDIKFNTPGMTLGFAEYMQSESHRIAAGMQLTYELLTGDLSQVNFTSYKAGRLEFDRLVRTMRAEVIIPLLCQRIWDWWIEAAILVGRLPNRAYPVKWSNARFGSVNPIEDAKAKTIRVRSGLETLTDAIAAEGGDINETLAERAKELKKLAALEIVTDSDPSMTTNNGQLQSVAAGGNPNPTQVPVE